MGQINKQKMKWQWEDNQGKKFDGEYEGEVKNGKPHGIGKWKMLNGQGTQTVEGEWKYGQSDGKVVHEGAFPSKKFYREYEAQNGKKNGKQRLCD